MARIQRHAFLAFRVSGRKLEAKNTNPVLHKFYHMLNDFRIQEGAMKVVVNSKDPAVIKQVDSSWLKGSIHLDMEIINYPSEIEDVAVGIDHETSALILNELAKLRVEEGKYPHRVTIEVMEATFSENYRQHPDLWPDEPLFVTLI